MKLPHTLPVLVTLTCLATGLPSPENKQTKQEKSIAPIFYATETENGAKSTNLREKEPRVLSQQQQILPQFYQPEIANTQYLESQFQYPEGFPRVPLQIVLYGPGGQGQPILINPGSPPGNFLVPQAPGPNVILRDTPQRPVFVAGYPKPAHVPPIEKDAEEIPTNPEKIPPFQDSHPTNAKPEKLETFNEGENHIPTQPAEEPAAKFPKLAGLRPGQRFFILNGEPLFSNYPLGPLAPQNVNLKYAQPLPYSNVFLRNPPQAEINFSPNLVPLSHNAGQVDYFRGTLPPLGLVPGQDLGQFRYTPSVQDTPFQFQDDVENESIVVDAAFDDVRSVGNQESEGVSTASNEKSAEQSVAQAGPGAVAVAGSGGAAEAAPKGTAITGKGGLSVSSPRATAVAGQKEEKKPAKKN